MNKEQMWAVLECCLLYSEGMTYNKLINLGFSSEVAGVGNRLYYFLLDKEMVVEEGLV